MFPLPEFGILLISYPIETGKSRRDSKKSWGVMDVLRIIGLTPHPPLLIPGVSPGDISRVQQTVAGMERLSRLIREAAPELLILITPHGPLLHEGIAVLEGPRLEGDFADFGAPRVKVCLETDSILLEQLQRETEGEPLRPVIVGAADYRFRRRHSLDHGAAVPLYYLQQAGLSVPGLHLTYTFAPREDLYRFGQSLRRAVEARGLPAAVIASGDLSHRLIPGAPAGYNPRGIEYDRLMVELLRQGRVREILALDEAFVEEAGECALRSYLIALGALSGQPFRTGIISYEGPFGVGYLVAELRPASGISSADKKTSVERAGVPVSPAPLAREALRHYLERGRPLAPPEPLPDDLSMRAGAFVSLKKGGELRGCIGTVEPVRKNLAEEIIMNAVSAGMKDPRFEPVRAEEIDDLEISVDVLMPPERIEDPGGLDPRKYGVLLRSGQRSGLLLPDLEGIDTAAEQIAIARRKAGIGPREPVELYRFEVRRYS